MITDEIRNLYKPPSYTLNTLKAVVTKAVDKNKLPPIEQGHTLTELTMGLYVALCNDLKL